VLFVPEVPVPGDPLEAVLPPVELVGAVPVEVVGAVPTGVDDDEPVVETGAVGSGGTLVVLPSELGVEAGVDDPGVDTGFAAPIGLGGFPGP
jgi:hypothetical protein